MSEEYPSDVLDALDALDAIDRARKLLDPVQLRERYAQLELLRSRIDFQMIVVENALRAADAWSRPGRPRKAQTHTRDEAKEAHRRWKHGERTPWVEAGHRQYERDNKRMRRRAEAESGADTPISLNED
jgi:hypothetical protein